MNDHDELLQSVAEYILEGETLGVFVRKCYDLNLPEGQCVMRQVVLPAPNGHPMFVVTTQAALDCLRKTQETKSE